MVIVLDKNMSKDKIGKQLKLVLNKKRIKDKARYFGAIKWKEDPLVYQKKLRDDWA